MSILTFISGLISGSFLEHFFLKKREEHNRKDCLIMEIIFFVKEFYKK